MTANEILKLVVLAGVLLLGYLAAGLFQRRGVTPVTVDPVTRYRRARRAVIFFGIVLATDAILTFTLARPLTLSRFFLLACFLVMFGALICQYVQARKKFLELPVSARQQASRRAPSFFWQTVFILAPVTLMASFGFWAIVHQRRMVEQDAQARAREIVRGLPDDFGRSAAACLTEFDACQGGWLYYVENGAARWPADPLRHQVLDDTNEQYAVSNDLAILRTAFPDWATVAPPLGIFMLDTNGEPLWQQPLPPRPPDWLAVLTPGQCAAWTALAAADLAGQPAPDLATLAKRLKETNPPNDAAVCADFMVLRAESRNVSAAEAVRELLGFAGRNDTVKSDSGLPLSTLALAEALRRSRECGPSEPLWNALRNESLQAGFLAPRLLDEAAGIVAGNVDLLGSIKAMQICLADRRLRSGLADALVQDGAITGADTNLWLDAQNRRWLCLIQRNKIRSESIISGQPPTTISVWPEARCYPQSAVARAFGSALGQAKVSLPDYLAVNCELEGEPLLLPPPWGKPSSPTNAEVLAEAHFRMSLPARGSHDPGEFESMPSHPAFTLRVLLADRHLLYARQRQLQWIFGSLIGLSLLTAIAGFVTARGAFHRQLQLNEQKSNFVSSVSHELRAPIASVRLMAENLERGKISEPARQSEYFRFIVQECRRLSSLIENVLDFSRIEQGRKQYEFEPTNLVALMETTVKLMEPYAAEKGVSLKTETVNLPPSTPNLELNVDGRALQQALVNLIDNAVKHSPKGETVTVGIERRAAVPPAPRELSAGKTAPQDPQGMGGTPILLYVSDHGPGIPKREHEKIFERFYRLGSELRRETQGVGIGLSVVKHIVEAHGGRVIVDSELLRGSRFTIELPAPS